MNKTLMGFVDRESIVRTVTDLFVWTDEGNWPGVRSCFAPEVTFQMGGGAGEGPRPLTPEEITDLWSEALEGMDAVHHQIGNVRVEVLGRDEADVKCHGIAFHHERAGPSGGSVRTFVGTYELHMVEVGHHWKVDGFLYHPKFQHESADPGTGAR